jgi:hypothetical protein
MCVYTFGLFVCKYLFQQFGGMMIKQHTGETGGRKRLDGDLGM